MGEPNSAMTKQDLLDAFQTLEHKLYGKFDTLEQKLDGKFVTIDQRLGKLEAMEQRLEGKIDASADRLRTELVEKIRESETSLLTEFSKWSMGNHLHLKELEAKQKTLTFVEETHSDRMTLLEERILTIEARLRLTRDHNPPPAQ